MGWQEPENGKRIYIVSDNSKMLDFADHLSDQALSSLALSNGESKTNRRINLGIHYYNNELRSSNYIGICRLKAKDNSCIHDNEGNELLLKIEPRFNISVTEMLNYIRDDDEFERYMAPQTTSNRYHDKEIEAIDNNEIFTFYWDEKPIKVNDDISHENSIITATAFLSLLRFLCKRPLMGRMLKDEANLTGKIKGKIVIEKNIRTNTMHGRNDRFFCRYLHYTDDIVENQILKAALKKAKRFIAEHYKELLNGSNSYSSAIAYCSNTFRSISDCKVTGNDCNGLKFSGCYAYYKPVISLAKMILDDISIESNGSVNTTGFVIPYAISMEKLYEVYVRAYLKKNGVHSYKEQFDHGIRIEKFDNKTDVFVEDKSLENPGKHISGPIKPDIVLTKIDTEETLVFDVKYKKNTTTNASDRLQLLAYSMMLNADNVGIILPPINDSDVDMIFDPRRVNSLETRLIKYHEMLLGMNKNSSKIADYIKEIASGNSSAPVE